MKIYHNPRCTKSRLTLQLLLDKGYNPEVVEYLKTGFRKGEVAMILEMLDMHPRRFIRKDEMEYKESGADNPDLSRDALIHIIEEYPILFQRPVVVDGNRAAIGRPPENVLALVG